MFHVKQADARLESTAANHTLQTLQRAHKATCSSGIACAHASRASTHKWESVTVTRRWLSTMTLPAAHTLFNSAPNTSRQAGVAMARTYSSRRHLCVLTASTGAEAEHDRE